MNLQFLYPIDLSTFHSMSNRFYIYSKHNRYNIEFYVSNTSLVLLVCKSCPSRLSSDKALPAQEIHPSWPARALALMWCGAKLTLMLKLVYEVCNSTKHSNIAYPLRQMTETIYRVHYLTFAWDVIILVVSA